MPVISFSLNDRHCVTSADVNALNLTHTSEASTKIVAIHGLGSASTAWKMLKSRFGPEVDFITVEMPGHGKSNLKASPRMSPQKLSEIIRDELVSHGIEYFHLTGNSLGGWVALELAAAYPENVASVTSIAPAGLWLKPIRRKSYQLDTIRLLAKATHRYCEPLLRLKPLRILGFKKVSPQWRDIPLETCVDATIAMGSSTGYRAFWNGMVGNRFDKPIAEEIPVTVIFGDTDNTLPKSKMQEKSLLPAHSNWVELKDSGHAPMWDQVDSVADIIRSLISSGDRAARR